MRKWAEKSIWYRTPHADDRHESLWWYKEEGFGVPTAGTHFVIDIYLDKCAHGRKIQPGEKERLLGYLQELAHPHRVTVRRVKYWTLQGFALKHLRANRRQWFYKMFRRLEETAEMLFPDHVPPHRRAGVRNLELRQKRAAAAERRRAQILTEVTP